MGSALYLREYFLLFTFFSKSYFKKFMQSYIKDRENLSFFGTMETKSSQIMNAVISPYTIGYERENIGTLSSCLSDYNRWR